MAEQLDPRNVNAMLYEELAQLLADFKEHRDDIPFKERATILTYIMRVQLGFIGLRKEDNEPDGQGSAVSKYSKAFTINAARGRTKNARAAAAFADDDDA